MLTQEQNLPLSLVQPPIGLLAQFEGERSFWTSILANDDDSKMRLYNAREGESLSLSDMVNKSIHVQDVLIHPVQIARQDGEVIDLLRIVLISPSGEQYSSSGRGIASSLRAVFASWGPPPYSPPMVFTVVRIPLSEGRQTFKLMPVAPTGSTGKEKKK